VIQKFQKEIQNRKCVALQKVAQKITTQDFPHLKFKPKTLINKVKHMENVGISLNAVSVKRYDIVKCFSQPDSSD